MSLILKLLAVGLVHLAFFAGYPDTGPYGNYYLAVSLLVWGVFIIFINTSTKFIRLVSGLVGLAVNLAAFALMGAALAATMPQAGRQSVLEKIQAGRYPDKKDLRAGLGRFGINLDKEVKNGLKVLDAEAGKAVEKLKDEVK
ncbi:MAG: hypothetical protein NDI60_07665 [Elusimicrobiales bacterium]|nr:hypothetical protein [Elusimicrobiales bacterium]